MSLSNKLIATSTLLFVTLSGVSPMVNAADTMPIVRESCPQAMPASLRYVGHPAKSIDLKKRAEREPTQCAVTKSQPLILASYVDARGGQALVRGKTERALKEIYARKSAKASAAELTNLCVAQTVQRQWSQAADACDAAVASALSERANTGKWEYTDRKFADKGVGAAYSNRAVMHWLAGNEVAAHNDLIQARQFSPNASYVTRNLRVAESAPSLARAVAEQPLIG